MIGDVLAAIQSVDEDAMRSLAALPPPAVAAAFVFTTLGGGWGLLFVLPFVGRPATRLAAVWTLGAVVAASLATTLAKALIGRPRPCETLGWCALAEPPTDPSLPSGHAAGSFAFATFVALVAPRFAPAAYLVAVLVACSRCALGVHYPSDVCAGALLGSAIGAAAWALYRRVHGHLDLSRRGA